MSALLKKASTTQFLPFEAPRPEPVLKILVVDDEKSIADGLSQMLSPENGKVVPIRKSSRTAPQQSREGASNGSNVDMMTFDVTTVYTAEAALNAVRTAQAQGKPYAMGFFDVLLGEGMDGIQLVKQIQSLDAHIFCVFVTAYQDRSVDSINEILGPQNIDRWDYINKPFTEGEIVQKARMVTKLYHLQRVREWQDQQLGQAHQFVLENERMNTVAAVGRSVAHEFGNLLMQIVGHADIALMKNEPERMKQALETILKASDTATAVLGRFKKMAHHGDFNVDKKPTNLLLTVNESLELMSYQLKASSVEIKKGKMDSVLVEANHHALVQVLMNLLINAIHAMPEGGEIEVSCERISTGAEIRVRDHGSGIPEQFLAQVTEPLFTTKGEQGTGLGLAISKEIIEIQHQGEFVIRNHSEKGVEVIFRIPSRQATELSDGEA